jgi:PKD repeat protein
MKRILYILLALPLFIISCEKTPVASFSTDTNEPEVGKPVFFNNNSHNSDRFEWDFGDGYVSSERDPVHTFTSTGSYEVSLTAISKNRQTDKSTLTLNVLVPTLLVIEVREYYSGDLIPNASIRLYPTLADWEGETSKIDEGFTDYNGVAVFSGLDAFIYYVDVWEATHDNYTLKSEDVGFIQTPTISAHQITFFTAWVDVATHPKGATGGTREMVIKKLERKAIDRPQKVYTGTETWQELYSRRSVK